MALKPALFELLAVTQLVAADLIDGANQHEDHHNHHDDRVDGNVRDPCLDALSEYAHLQPS